MGSCLIKSNDIPQVNIQNVDKIIHAFFYFVFTSLWFLYFKKQINSFKNIKPLVISFVFSIFFGIIIEFIQEFYTATRQADAFDVVANAVGAILAVVIIVLLDRNNYLNKI